MKNRGQPLIAILGALSLVLITAGVSLALFDYVKTGTEDNVISTGSITFIYDEETGQGRGVTLADAMPISNELGKAEPTNVFNFRITSNPGTTNIKYTISARKVSDGNTLDDVVDLYLTNQTNNGDYIADQYPSKITQEKTILTFDDLDGYKNSSIEKILYEKTITSSDLTNGKYEQDFRLRMWIDENTDFSDGTYNNQTFKIIVNVNANVDTSVVPSGGSNSGSGESGNSGSGSGNSGSQASNLITTVNGSTTLPASLSQEDLVCFNSECFYVMESIQDGYTKLIAKYNLKVGTNVLYDGYIPSSYVTVDPLSEGYGMQDSEMFEIPNQVNGTVPFTTYGEDEHPYYVEGDYWDLIGDYQETCPEGTETPCTNIYNPTIRGENGYSIAEYVEPYRDALEQMGVIITKVRIPLIEDYDNIGCIRNSQSCDFLFRQPYWLATYDSGYIDVANEGGTLVGDVGAQEDYSFGVRPLVIVPTSTITQ